MLRLIIKGKQGSGKTQLAAKVVAMLNAGGESVSVQDGEHTIVHHVREPYKLSKAPVTVAIIVKQT